MLFRVLTLAGGLLWLASGAGCDGCSGGGFDAGVTDVPSPGGRFSLNWSVVDRSSNRAVSCDKLDPNATVFVQMTREGTGAAESFACKNLQATDMVLAAGTYSFTYELHLPASGLIIPASAVQSGVVVSSNETVTLPPITFQVDANGRLQLTLRSDPAGNCAGGAAITGFSFSLEHAGGAGDTGCAPVMFQLSGGGTYNANDCTSPAVTRCIEASETLTVTSLPSGPYQIHVRGKKGTLDCWRNDDQLRVPPQGQVLPVALNLALSTTTPGCL